MGMIRPMRPVKLLFISLLFFFGLLTAVGLLFPATVHISRAIDLRGQRKTDLMQRIVDASFQACWVGDSGQLLMKNGIRRTDSSIFVSLSNSKQQLGWIFHGTDGAITMQARIDVALGWLPWQRFQSLLMEPRYGPWLEAQLNKFQQCLLDDQVVYSP
jgi:hypothetical protein